MPLPTMKGQWAPFQSRLDLADDEKGIAHEMLSEGELAAGDIPGSASIRTYRTRPHGDRHGLGPYRGTQERGSYCLKAAALMKRAGDDAERSDEEEWR